MEYKGIVFDRYVLKSPEIDANGYVVVDLLDEEVNETNFRNDRQRV